MLLDLPWGQDNPKMIQNTYINTKDSPLNIIFEGKTFNLPGNRGNPQFHFLVVHLHPEQVKNIVASMDNFAWLVKTISEDKQD